MYLALRTGNLADMNILAHTDPKNRRVKGVRFDPFNEHVCASFSDIGNEPVKIWDLRKVYKDIMIYICWIWYYYNIVNYHLTIYHNN
jgi:hypothetical protein